MPPMSVTLEVSKLSGWLNDDAPCRGRRKGIRCEARYAVRATVVHVQAKARLQI